jgi:predicted alpha/beta-fold hydrolase
MKYDRELFKLSDGGTIALDWHIDESDGIPSAIGEEDFYHLPSKRPILCLISGLSGGNDNLYVYSMVKEATLAGYKCVVINFRGAAGVPLTSRKLYWFNSWEDIKEPIDYIHRKYCCKKSTHSLIA